MGSVSLEDWSLIWDRTNRWIQLKGIDGEFEIETSPVESAIGPFIVQTGHTVVSTFLFHSGLSMCGDVLSTKTDYGNKM